MSEEAMSKKEEGAMGERDSMHGTSVRERRRAPAGRANGPDCLGIAPARMACAALLSCALAACPGGSGPSPSSANAALTVMASDVASGSVSVVVGSSTPMNVLAGNSGSVDITAGDAVTLTADPIAGYGFSIWTLLPDELACESGAQANPCALPAGSVTVDATVEATFEAVPSTLTIAAGTGGSVKIEIVGAVATAVGPGSMQGFAFSVEAAATLTAVATAGHVFAGWTLSNGLACESGAQANPCALPAGSVTDDATVEAVFVALSALTVVADTGGSVETEIVDAIVATVGPGSTRGFAVSVLSTATLTAVATAGYAFVGWTLSGGLSVCAAGTGVSPCMLPAGSVTADARAEATFVVMNALTVATGAGGSVAAEVAGADAVTVGADSSQSFAFSVLSAATLTAVAADGWAFAGWTSPDELACESGAQADPCELPVGSVTAGATVSATFEAVPSTLTVAAGANGSVAAEVAGAGVATVGADSSQSFSFSVLSTAVLTAVATAGHTFAGWTLSGPPGLACADGPEDSPCALPAGSVTAGATVSATFDVVPSTLTVAAEAGGSVAAELAGAGAVTVTAGSSRGFTVTVASAATLTAVAATGYIFAGWTLSNGLACAGGTETDICALPVGSVTADTRAEATFVILSTLTVATGANGSVRAEVAGADAVTVGADSSRGFAFSVLSTATLRAVAADGWAFAGWTLSGPPGLACADGPEDSPCALATGSVTAGATVSATFEAVPSALTVAAGAGGSVAAEVAGAGAVTVGADSSRGFAFNVLSTATLTAVAADGWAFAGWTSPDGPACTDGPENNPCALAAGSVTAGATVSATFGAVPSTLTVGAGTGGSVRAKVAGAVTVTADSSRGFTFSVLSTATLRAVAADGYIFAGWTLSGPPSLACTDGPEDSPCALATGSVTAGATVSATFEAVPSALTVGAGTGGSVRAEVAGAGAVTVGADSLRGFAFSVLSAATLTAVAADGWAFAGWTSPDGLACESGAQADPCALAAGSVTAGATVSATFEAVPSTLTVAAGTGGSVRAEVAGAVTVGADSSRGFTFSVLSTATLRAVAADGWAFAGWTLSGPPGLACADGPEDSPCALATGSVTAGATVSATFEAVPSTLTVGAGTGGSVRAEVAGAVTVGADSSRGFAFSVLSAATLTAVAADGWAFAGWTSPDGLACADGPEDNPCALATGSVTAGATVSATFGAVPSTLTVAAGTGGSVRAEVASAVTVGADSSRGFAFSVLSAATLRAVAATGYIFAGWTLSNGLACAGGTEDNPCALAVGSVTAGATVSAAFEAVPSALTVGAGTGGSVRAEVAGAGAVTVGADSLRGFAFSILSTATLTAVAANGWAFAGWTSPDELACAGGPEDNPCTLPAGSVTAGATVSATFEAVPSTLTVGAGTGGSVRAEVAGAVTVGADSLQSFTFSVLSTATLTAVPTDGWAFAGWTSPDGLACADGPEDNPCALATGSVTAGATVSATFEAVPSTLTVGAGTGGSVRAEVAGAVTIGADSSRGFAFSVLSTATLTAVAADGWAFAGWTLSNGLACAGGTEDNPCALPAGSVTADATVSATFGAVPSSLTVAAGAGGSVAAEVAGAGAATVGADSLRGFAFSVLSAATLTAVATDGWAFAGWTSPDGLACADGPEDNPCALPAGSVTADARAEAAFEAVPSTLTVAAGTGGSVAAEVAGAGAVTVGADSSRGFAFSVLSAATLTTVAADGYGFAGWTLSGELACESGAQADPCALPVGSVTADARAEAAFEAVPSTLTVGAGANGSVRAEVAGADAVTVGADSLRGFAFSVLSAATLTAVATDGWAFAGWTSPDGLACESGAQADPCALPVGSVTAGATVSATFEAVPSTLTVAAGAGGSVRAEVAGAGAVTVSADSSRGFAFSVLSAATLTAVAADGWAFAGWTSPDGLACAGDLEDNPCALATGSVTAGATVSATFEAVPSTLTVGAGAGGSVRAEVAGAGAVTVGADSSRGFAFSVLSAATLTVVAADGWAFAGWTLSGPPGLACADGPEDNPCALPAGSVTAGATVSATFGAVPSTLTVGAGTGGSVRAEVAGAVTVGADSSQSLVFSVLSAATLTAVAADGWAFAGWTLSGPPGLACADGPADNPCALAAGSVTAGATVSATFGAVPSTLTVAAGTGGSVATEVAGASAVTVGADSSRGFAFSVLSAATLTAVAADGYGFAGWTLSGPPGLACAGPPKDNPCALATGSVTADATVSVAFEAVPSSLTVAAGTNGSVAAEVAGADAVTVGADSSRGFAFSVLSTATLTAVATDGHEFAGWTLSGPPGLACADGPEDNPCALPAGSVTAGATVSAAFARPPAAWNGPGSVSVSVSGDGATHTAVAYASGALERWTGAPCEGSEGLSCDVSSVMAGEDLPVAVFHPFVVDGIKSLAFGLGYHGDAPNYFRISFQEAMGAGYTPVPSLEELEPGSEPARLAVSVHLLPWKLGAYLTEACDDSDICTSVDGNQRTLEQSDSVLATGYFKAPNADAGDNFGMALALSVDGATLAVGAPSEDSASAGVFAPGGMGYQAALNSGAASNSGAVYVYRRPDADGLWTLEAFVKAPKAGANDKFGTALALSRDGTTLAVGAPQEDSASAGVFVPGGTDYQAALNSGGASNSGAVTVYRRPDADGLWTLEAFVKAPKADANDKFGTALALSTDGTTLAVGAPSENGASDGVFTPGGMGYQAALDNNGSIDSGAVTVYRRSDSVWSIKAFVKAPRTGTGDWFGSALALSGDGAALVVGARREDSASSGVFVPGGTGYQTALNSGGGSGSGAVTVYRRSESEWSVEAFIKAPKAGADDKFGTALALSADGAALVVGALYEDSAPAGVFVPGGTGYQTALESGGAADSGAVTVYRRSDSGWSVEAFFKAPKTGASDWFGSALALSADGTALAVGAPQEDSAFAGVFAPGDAGYQTALDNNGARFGGGAYIYLRPPGSDTWTTGNFVKASNAREGRKFGSALALSGDGTTLAVSTPLDGGSARSQPIGGGSSNTQSPVTNAGAAYLY